MRPRPTRADVKHSPTTRPSPVATITLAVATTIGCLAATAGPAGAAPAHGGPGPADLCTLTVSASLLKELGTVPGCVATALAPYPAALVKAFPDWAGIYSKEAFWGQPTLGIQLIVYVPMSPAKFKELFPNGGDFNFDRRQSGNFYEGWNPPGNEDLNALVTGAAISLAYHNMNDTTPKRYLPVMLSLAREIAKQI